MKKHLKRNRSPKNILFSSAFDARPLASIVIVKNYRFQDWTIFEK